MANANRETIISKYQCIVNTFKIEYVASVVLFLMQFTWRFYRLCYVIIKNSKSK